MSDPNINYTVRKLILAQVENVVVDIDSLFKYYAQDITPDLMIVLEEILKSNKHRVLADNILQIKHPLSINDGSGTSINIIFGAAVFHRESGCVIT